MPPKVPVATPVTSTMGQDTPASRAIVTPAAVATESATASSQEMAATSIWRRPMPAAVNVAPGRSSLSIATSKGEDVAPRRQCMLHAHYELHIGLRDD